MTLHTWLIVACWIVFIAYWAVSAVGAKRNLDRPKLWRVGGLHLSLVVLALLAFHVPAVRQWLHDVRLVAASSVATASIGVVLCAFGVGLAIWARVHIGRNWGMPMSRKENPELVTTGSYAVIRHPIYAGILLAMIGSALGTSPAWLLLVVLFAPYFVASGRTEEKLMLEQFPEQYADYMKRTKMLLPFVF